MISEENKLKLVEQLKQKINEMLDLCDPVETPYLCSIIRDKSSRQNIVDMIYSKAEAGTSVSNAIIEIEREYDPNYELN